MEEGVGAWFSKAPSPPSPNLGWESYTASMHSMCLALHRVMITGVHVCLLQYITLGDQKCLLCVCIFDSTQHDAFFSLRTPQTFVELKIKPLLSRDVINHRDQRHVI